MPDRSLEQMRQIQARGASVMLNSRVVATLPEHLPSSAEAAIDSGDPAVIKRTEEELDARIKALQEEKAKLHADSEAKAKADEAARIKALQEEKAKAAPATVPPVAAATAPAPTAAPAAPKPK